MCNLCGIPIYIKIPKIQASLTMPAIRTGELIQELEDITGEMYVQLGNYQFCPMCGKKLGGENEI